MGAGTSSGKANSREQRINNAKWTGQSGNRSFGIVGVGGASVRKGTDEFGNTGYIARVWTPNSNANQINGGRAFSSEKDAMNTAKKVLKNRQPRVPGWQG